MPSFVVKMALRERERERATKSWLCFFYFRFLLSQFLCLFPLVSPYFLLLHPIFRAQKLGKSKRGLTNGGLSPKFSEKIGGKSFLENRAFSGQNGAISGLVGAFSGPIGTNSSAPHSHGARAEIATKGPFLARLAPFGLSPPLLSPRLDVPEKNNANFFCTKFFENPSGHGRPRQKS